jgi:hypothetical protein
MSKIPIVLILVLCLNFTCSSDISAISKLGCTGIGFAEFVFPGLASTIFLGEWDNAIFLGLPHYSALSKANEAKESKYYQKDSNFPIRINLTEEEIDSVESFKIIFSMV